MHSLSHTHTRTHTLILSQSLCFPFGFSVSRFFKCHKMHNVIVTHVVCSKAIYIIKTKIHSSHTICTRFSIHSSIPVDTQWIRTFYRNGKHTKVAVLIRLMWKKCKNLVELAEIESENQTEFMRLRFALVLAEAMANRSCTSIWFDASCRYFMRWSKKKQTNNSNNNQWDCWEKDAISFIHSFALVSMHEFQFLILVASVATFYFVYLFPRSNGTVCLVYVPLERQLPFPFIDSLANKERERKKETRGNEI